MVASRAFIALVGALLCSSSQALPKRPSTNHAIYPANDEDRILLAYHKEPQNNDDNSQVKHNNKKKKKNGKKNKKSSSSRAVVKADENSSNKDGNNDNGVVDQYKQKLRKVMTLPTSTPIFTMVGNVQVGFFLAALWLYKSKLWFCSLLA